jgi:hypothetical protein
MDYALIQRVETNDLKKGPFIKELAEMDNQKFVEEFIKKYKILDLYPERDFTQLTKDLLWSITLLKRTSLLKLFLIHLDRKLGKGLLLK